MTLAIFSQTLSPKYENNIVVGDFNLHVNDENDHEVNVFSNTITALGLTQHVSIPTQKDNTLDLIMTEIHSKISLHEIIPGPYISERRAIMALLDL